MGGAALVSGSGRLEHSGVWHRADDLGPIPILDAAPRIEQPALRLYDPPAQLPRHRSPLFWPITIALSWLLVIAAAIGLVQIFETLWRALT